MAGVNYCLYLSIDSVHETGRDKRGDFESEDIADSDQLSLDCHDSGQDFPSSKQATKLEKKKQKPSNGSTRYLPPPSSTDNALILSVMSTFVSSLDAIGR